MSFETLVFLILVVFGLILSGLERRIEKLERGLKHDRASSPAEPTNSVVSNHHA